MCRYICDCVPAYVCISMCVCMHVCLYMCVCMYLDVYVICKYGAPGVSFLCRRRCLSDVCHNNIYHPKQWLSAESGCGLTKRLFVDHLYLLTVASCNNFLGGCPLH